MTNTIVAAFLGIARKARSSIRHPVFFAAEHTIPSATERRRNMLIDNRINRVTTLRVRGGCAAIVSLIALLGTSSSWAQVIGLSPSFGEGTIPNQVYIADAAIEPVTMPEASGGDGELTYHVLPELPEGLRFDEASRTLSGTPTASQARTIYELFATDADGDAATVFFYIEVIEDLMPSFAEDVGRQIWAENLEIEPLVLPTAEGGNPELEYSLEGELPEGLELEYDAATATWKISGTPGVSPPPTEYTWTATDVDGDSDEIRFYVFGSVSEDLVPEFVGDVPDQVYVDGSPIEPLSLPLAMGGTGELDELEYSLEGELPEGLEYDPEMRTISGTPAGSQSPTEYTWTVTDANGDVVELIFSLMVEEDVNPEFSGEVQNQTWIQNSEIAVLGLPGAEGGNAPYVYSISPEVPTGLSFWAGDQTISGTPTEVQERTVYTYRAVDADGDPVELTFSLEVIEDLMPSFAEGVGEQVWTEDSEVEALVLPEGLSGNGDLTYELSPELAEGLVFDPETRTISGTPVVPKEQTRYVYRTVDVDGDAAELTFSVMVLKDLMPSFPEAVQNQTWIQDSEIAALDLPGAESGNGAITYSITPELPAGLTFRKGDQTILGTPTE